MSASSQTLFEAVLKWIERETSIKSVALFGSSVEVTKDAAQVRDQWSDIDLHVVSTNPEGMERIDWKKALPNQAFCAQSVRPASGGVRKITVVFAAGQIDLVVVPLMSMRLARWGVALGLHRTHQGLGAAMVSMRSCLRSGFRMLKGEAAWGGFYGRVFGEMEEIRLCDPKVIELAEVSLVDQLWILQKLQRGEIIAAQHQLHFSVVDINLQLLRELRLRRNLPLPSFGLGRHVEKLLSPEELNWVRIDARCEGGDLHRAVRQANAGLLALMRELVPAWKPAPEMTRLLNRFSSLL